MKMITGRKREQTPGDTAYVMSHKHVDTDGREWPAGTVYQQVSAGMDNVLGKEIQTVKIGIEVVRFGKPKLIMISEADFKQHCEEHNGCCLNCHEWTDGDCEPDARRYKCENCEAMKVYGAEELVLMGRIEFLDYEKAP